MNGKEVTTKKVIVPTFQRVVVKGLTKVTGHQKYIHVLVEPSPKCMSIFVPGNTPKLIPGGSGVAVVLRNLSRRDVTLEHYTEIGMVTPAKIVPSIQIPSKQDLDENEKVQCMSVQAELSDEVQQEETEPEDILQKIDLSGIDDWDPKIQQEVRDLIYEYTCIFS